MFLLSNSLIPALTVSQHNVTFCASRHLSDENKSISKREKNESTVRCGFSCRRWLISLAFRSGRSEQPHLANQRHVPPVCGGQRRGTTPGWQEAQIQHQDQEQQLVTKVQWNIPIVSNRELPLCLEPLCRGWSGAVSVLQLLIRPNPASSRIFCCCTVKPAFSMLSAHYKRACSNLFAVPHDTSDTSTTIPPAV